MKSLIKNYCVCCGKELIKGQYKFCSRSCSAKITNIGKHKSVETKNNLSEALKLYKDKQVIIDNLYGQGFTYSEISNQLNISLSTIKNYIKNGNENIHILSSKKEVKMIINKNNRYEEDVLIYAISLVNNYVDLCEVLNLKVKGDNIKTIQKYICLYNINCSHFISKPKVFPCKRKLDEILVVNSGHKCTNGLKLRLFKEGFKKNKCECCGIEEWNGKPISCQLHHINGVKNDNRLENLQILCPNCHTQTDNYGSKNIVNK